MKQPIKTIALLTVVFAFLLGTFLVGQGWKKWEESSPPIGKQIPEVKIYDRDLDQVPLSNLHKGTYLYFQWGGCT